MFTKIEAIIDRYQNDSTRLMDILITIQNDLGFIPNKAVKTIAEKLGISTVDVRQTLSFYHFFTESPAGKYSIFLNDSVVANMMGRPQIKLALEKEVGCSFGNVSADGLIGLYSTSCIGMNDQEPAAIINNVVFTKLTPYRAREIVRDIRAGKKVCDLIVEGLGDGYNQSDLIRSMVNNNIRKKGPILSSDYRIGSAIKKIVTKSPEDVLEEIKSSNLRGRGGAGFPTGVKWELARKADATQKYVFCNADEGEPGTFKDRVILTELPRLLFEGMIVAGYAIGATEGILYVRYEYKYLELYLESILQGARDHNMLGKNIAGKKGFNFDIRIQFGAGAYVCGEESALIESAEGKRGEPRDRPPFPVEVGYLGKPTIVNNVETLCSVVKVILHGGEWYRSFGTKDSTGTKLLSVSGDCIHPGVYEIEWGFSVNDVLEMVGAYEVQAVQVGGPSGSLIGPSDFNRVLSYSDLSTGGSLIIFGPQRDLLRDVVLNFTDFFIEESCGSCSLCRIMPVILRKKMMRILDGYGTSNDIDELQEWAKVMKLNRCGLGQTAANPIVTSLKNFRYLYQRYVNDQADITSNFDLDHAMADALRATGRKAVKEEVIHE